MKKVFSSMMLYEAQLRKDALERAGIECALQNETLSMAMGEIPFTECYPELWVEDADYERALKALEAFERESADGE